MSGPHWLAGPLLLGLAGTFKGTPAASWFPLDLTLFGIILSTWGVLSQLYLSRGYAPPALRSVLLLWVSFVPGAAIAAWSGLHLTKSATLFSATLLCALAGLLLIQSPITISLWYRAQVAFAVLLLPLAYLFPDPYTFARGQVSILGSTTISIGRLAGAGALIALVSLVCCIRRKWWNATVALVLGVFLLIVGNRAAFLALMIAVVLTAVFAKRFVRYRKRLIVALAAILTLALGLLASGHISASGRVRALIGISSDSFAESNSVRISLLDAALQTIADRPQGVGWGGIGNLPELQFGLGENVYPHNVAVEIFAEGGWVAGLAFIAFAIYALVRAQRASHCPLGVLLFATTLYWFLVALFSEDINGNRMMWISFGVALGAHLSQKETVRRDPNFV